MAKKEVNTKSERNSSLFCMRYFAMACSAVLVISAFLSWGSVANELVVGMKVDGMITLFLGLAAFLSLTRRRIPLCLPMIFGLLALAVSIWDYLSISKIIPTVQGEIGIGLYLTIVSSILLVFSSFIAWMRR